MVLGLKPMGKPSTQKKKLQVLDRTKALHGPRTQAYGETKYSKKKLQILDRTKALESTPEKSSPLISGLIPKLHGFPSLPSDSRYQGNRCNRNIVAYVVKTQLESLTARLPPRMNHLEFIVLGRSLRTHYGVFNCYLD